MTHNAKQKTNNYNNNQLKNGGKYNEFLRLFSEGCNGK